MSLLWYEGIKVINKAYEERDKQKLWEMWLARYPNMTKDDFIPFSEFYEANIVKNVSKRPAKDILAEAAEIRKKLSKKRR